MAGFNGTVLTTKGRNLQAKAQIGTALNFTKVKLGSGTLVNGQSLESLNDLITPVMTLTIQGMTTNSDGTSKITVLVTNNGLETGFYVREIGLYATDPQLGEILYSVSNAGTLADYLPAGGGAVVVEQLFELITVVGNATNVTAVIDTSLVLATKDDVITHNSNANAHSNLLALLHIWQNSHNYVVGDICYSTTASSYKYMECTVAGISATTEPAWGAIGTTIDDGTASWKVFDIRQGTTIGRIPGLIDVGGGKAGLPAVSGKLLTDISGVSIGTVLPFLATKPQAGWLACDTGALVSRATYPELWSWVQTDGPLITEAAWQAQAAVQSSVGYYSSGDGSTTFRLPRIVDYVRGGLTADVGTWQGDAIRNITGTIGGNLIPTGAFSIKNVNASLGTGSSGNNYTFDASTQVPTAEENRPKTIKMLYCVKAFDATTNQSLIDITALANDVAGKQNKLQYALIVDEKATGTAADSIAAGGWRTRVLNTVKYNTNNFVSLSNNQITISTPGTFVIRAVIPTGACDYSKCRIRNITDNSTIATCTDNATQGVSDGVTVRGVVVGIVTISASKVFEIHHYTSVTTTGGTTYAVAGDVETYTTVEITKID